MRSDGDLAQIDTRVAHDLAREHRIVLRDAHIVDQPSERAWVQNLEDFTRFLFLHLASVDGSLHPNERETIIENLNELFPGNAHEQKLAALEIEYKKLGFAAAEELLTDSWPKFSSIDPEMKKKLYANLFDIINSDARVNEEETKVLRTLKTWLSP